MPEQSILAWLAIGFAAGVIARFVLPGQDAGGMIVGILIGIGGALLAGFVVETMRWAASGTWQNYAVSALGAAAAVAVYRLVGHRRR